MKYFILQSIMGVDQLLLMNRASKITTKRKQFLIVSYDLLSACFITRKQESE
jgi:hypothetical protein